MVGLDPALNKRLGRVHGRKKNPAFFERKTTWTKADSTKEYGPGGQHEMTDWLSLPATMMHHEGANTEFELYFVN